MTRADLRASRSSRSFRFVLSLTLLGAALLIGASPVAAVWPTDPSVNLSICTADDLQRYPTVASDGNGGLIVAWSDHRSDSGDIYAQRIAADGTLLWATDGVALCTAAGFQISVQIVADGEGGAIVAWEDARTPANIRDIYAQRVDSNGDILWATDGIPVCTAPLLQQSLQMVSDENGGAIMGWRDFRETNDAELYVQRINADGIAQWGVNGRQLSDQGRNVASINIISSGNGGVIGVWDGHGDIFGQRLHANGTYHPWGYSDKVIASGPSTQSGSRIAPDGANGVFVVYGDTAYGDTLLRVTRVSSGGNFVWPEGHKSVYTTDGPAFDWYVAPDEANGIIVTWRYFFPSPNFQARYAQRLDENGTILWGDHGVLVAPSYANPSGGTLVADGEGGAVFVWRDLRSGDDTYAQRLDGNGNEMWQHDGLMISSDGSPVSYYGISWHPIRGAFFTWEADRNVAAHDRDIFGQNVYPNGDLGGPATGIHPPAARVPGIVLLPNAPNPFSAGTDIRYRLPLDASTRLEVFDVTGRRVFSQLLPAAQAGWNHHRFAGNDRNGRPLPNGVYMYRLMAADMIAEGKMVITR